MKFRSQLESPEDQKKYGDMAITTFDPDEVCHVRQEFARDCDINNIVRKFGIDGFAAHTDGNILTTDYNQTLQEAIGALRAAEAEITNLPHELREEFPTLSAINIGIKSGKLKLALDKYGEVLYKQLNKEALSATQPVTVPSSSNSPGTSTPAPAPAATSPQNPATGNPQPAT